MTPKDKLEGYGFVNVGKWFKTTNEKKRIDYSLDDGAKNQEDLNYAFVEGDKVFYIGVTSNTLSKRMNGYKYGKASEKDKYGKVEASTNKKVYKRILDLLNKDKEVEIYILPELNLGEYKGLKVSSVSGIEHSLIKDFDNGDLLNNIATKTNKVKQGSSKYISEDGKEFEMTLSKEYYNKGKIGFKKRSEHLLPNDTGVLMNIIIKDEMILQGTFTWSGKTRSINGKKELIKWYSDNFKLDEKILVKILDSRNVELSKV
ncbi:hypothetical protein DFQ10_107107 [Winogradskyella eximia]|uniref:GIY-YIG domain-containing protein n=1 Tax=Winogradskyella eximia TaxID=262006 RepID=A0A3D9H089_9FLAO|nr:hypothetical protein [Winogradskyella eximia]RED42922.1 hypothetical protein DFQ10_107107 [Winogradskyella eximia]